MMQSNQISYILSAVALVASSACVDDSSAAQAGARQQQSPRRQTGRTRPPPRQPAARAPQRDTARSPQAAARSPQPLPDSLRFVEHPEHINLGRTAPNPTSLRLTNPFDRDPQATTVGSQLYHSYNCIDCHGMDGSGAMGPSLADGRWRFGGSPSQVFESIYQGRPEGMPAWGGRISDSDVWRLVAYVRSLQVGKDVATENFTGKAQQRMGH
jgi:cytochrome c oxidase cbb3-type subunit III